MAPLAVCAGLKEPQVAAGVQVQSTPALALSFVTVAFNAVAEPTDTVAGAGVVKEIPTPAAAPEIVTVAAALTE